MYFPEFNPVDLVGQAPQGRRQPQRQPYQVLSDFARQHGFHVTSTTGGTHNIGSAHYEGRAIDVRTHNPSTGHQIYTDREIQDFANAARANGYIVRDERVRPRHQQVWSGPHLHLEVPRRSGQPGG